MTKRSWQRVLTPDQPCVLGHTEGRYPDKKCRRCVIDRATRYTARNKRKTAKRQRRYFQNNRSKWTGYRRKREGLPLPTRPCPDVCECCGNPPGNVNMHLDHDHETGAFRGWLCMRCNTAIGKLGDNIVGVMRAVAYLKKVARSEA